MVCRSTRCGTRLTLRVGKPSLISQDMYLAGSFIMMLSALTVVGTLLSDLLLAWLDPRIRYT